MTRRRRCRLHLGLANEDDYPREGVIDSVDNQLDTTSGTIRVRARFDNKDGALLPGLFARVEVGRRQPAIRQCSSTMPRSAPTRTRSTSWSSTLQDHAQYREVQVAGLHDGLRVVASGLKPGERIVVNGLQRVRPGDPVRPNAVQMAGRAARDAGFSDAHPRAASPGAAGRRFTHTEAEAPRQGAPGTVLAGASGWHTSLGNTSSYRRAML